MVLTIIFWVALYIFIATVVGNLGYQQEKERKGYYYDSYEAYVVVGLFWPISIVIWLGIKFTNIIYNGLKNN